MITCFLLSKRTICAVLRNGVPFQSFWNGPGPCSRSYFRKREMVNRLPGRLPGPFCSFEGGGFRPNLTLIFPIYI